MRRKWRTYYQFRNELIRESYISNSVSIIAERYTFHKLRPVGLTRLRITQDLDERWV